MHDETPITMQHLAVSCRMVNGRSLKEWDAPRSCEGGYSEDGFHGTITATLPHCHSAQRATLPFAAATHTPVQHSGLGYTLYPDTHAPNCMNSCNDASASASLQRQAFISGAPQSTTVPSLRMGITASCKSSSLQPPQASAGEVSATGSPLGAANGFVGFGSFSEALHAAYNYGSSYKIQRVGCRAQLLDPRILKTS